MKIKIMFLALALTIMFAGNALATGYVAGTASHTTLYTDAITSRANTGVVNVNDDLTISGTVQSTYNGNSAFLTTSSYGVTGIGSARGVSGSTSAGIGVRGAHTFSGNWGLLADSSYGVYGYHAASGNSGSLGSSSSGVRGIGTTYGVYGSGTNFGINGVSPAGEGVRGTNSNTGYYGQLGTANNGVRGYGNYAVSGINSGNNGISGYIGGPSVGVSGQYSNGNYGYLGSSGYGVRGEHSVTGNYGTLGSDAEGVYGRGNVHGGSLVNQNGNFLYGGGGSYGGYAKSGNNLAYLGDGSTNTGVYGTGTSVGVRGDHSVTGNYGYLGSSTYGVYGTSSTNHGVYGISSVFNAAGVYGRGSTYSVYGRNSEVANYGYLGGTSFGVYAECAGAGCTGVYTPNKIGAGGGFNAGSAAVCSDYTPGPGMNIGSCALNDVAEDIYSKDELESGDVVVIDGENNEHVRKSSKPYDTMVAGIISSNPAFHIQTSETGIPLALAGRVKAKASAENGAIKRGDLLTTSLTPGYLMKCESSLKCLGSIVGKALEPLDKDKGEIVVLVTLG